MQITYGSYQCDPNLVGLELVITPERDRRGVVRFQKREVTIRGAIKGVSQSEFKSKIEAFEAAFTQDYQDFKLLHDDATDSAHTLINSLTYSGVKCGPIRWLNKTPAEYVTVRHFEVSLWANYLVTGLPLISEFRETVSRMGTGVGPTIYTPCLDGSVHSQVIFPRVPVTIVQSGSAKGTSGYPPFPPKLLPGDWLQPPEMKEDRIGPDREGNLYTNYGISWSYVYQFVPSGTDFGPFPYPNKGV